MVDDVAWVQVLNPTLEPKLFPKMLESHVRKTLKKFQEYNKNNPDNNTKHSDDIDFEKHQSPCSMSFCYEEMTKVRSICAKYEVISSRYQMIWDFATEFIINKTKEGCCAIQTYIRQHAF